MKLSLFKDSTSNLIEFFVQDLSSPYGIGRTTLGFADFSVYYHRNKAAASVPASPTALTTVGNWQTARCVEVDPTNMKGLYQYGLPDAAVITGTDGSTSLSVLISDTNATPRFAPIPIEIQLVRDTTQPYSTLNQTLLKNVSGQYVYFFVWDNVTNAPATAANINSAASSNSIGSVSSGTCALKCNYSLDNGSFADLGAITTIVGAADSGNGVFRAPLTQANTNGDVIIFNAYIAASAAQTTPLARFTVRSFVVRTVAQYQSVKLTSDGLDSVSTALPAGATALSAQNYREKMNLLAQRFLGQHSKTPSTLTIFDDTLSALKTQTLTDDGVGNESVGTV